MDNTTNDIEDIIPIACTMMVNSEQKIEELQDEIEDLRIKLKKARKAKKRWKKRALMYETCVETLPHVDNGINIKGLEFNRTCGACPEQYDVYLNGQQVGYVRLRWGYLRADYPDCMCETIYETNVGGESTGEFESEEQRMYYLKIIADKILERIKQGEDNG